MYGRIATHCRVKAAVLDLGLMVCAVAGMALVPCVMARRVGLSPGWLAAGLLAAEVYALFDGIRASGTVGKRVYRLRIGRAYDGRAPSGPARGGGWGVE